MIDRARQEYTRLTRLPLGGWERHNNQPFMAFLRDFIADAEGRSPEDVQNEYEARGYMDAMNQRQPKWVAQAMTDEPKTSEQPSGHLRWSQPVHWSNAQAYLPKGQPHLQQLWYITRYSDLQVEQTEVWRDVPFVSEP